MSSTKDESSEPVSELFYLRMENLPWSASHQDIHDFFKEVAIPKGGISIQNKDVFVAVSTEEDLERSLKMNNMSIRDASIRLSYLEKSDLHKIRCKNVRRVLRFSTPENAGARSLRRIRPTFQSEDIKDTFSIFNPAEKEPTQENGNTILLENRKERRKIKPTKLKELSQYSFFFDEKENKSPQHCAKRLKIDEALLMAPILAV